MDSMRRNEVSFLLYARVFVWTGKWKLDTNRDVHSSNCFISWYDAGLLLGVLSIYLRHLTFNWWFPLLFWSILKLNLLTKRKSPSVKECALSFELLTLSVCWKIIQVIFHLCYVRMWRLSKLWAGLWLDRETYGMYQRQTMWHSDIASELDLEWNQSVANKKKLFRVNH